MNIFVLQADSGVTLLYKSLDNIKVKHYLLSGLLSALNQLALTEFKQPIESIDMGGLKWIYILKPDFNLLFVASDKKGTNAEILRARLSVIADFFIREFVHEKKLWNDKWEGNVEIFDPFMEKIDQYYKQWQQAEYIMSFADFYDILGILQQLFILVLRMIQEKIKGLLKDYLLQRTEEIFEQWKKSELYQQESEMHKITFSKNEPFNILTIDPQKCEFQKVKTELIKLLDSFIILVKKEIGYEASISYFAKENIYDYLVNNIELLKKLNIDVFLLNLFFKK